MIVYVPIAVDQMFLFCPNLSKFAQIFPKKFARGCGCISSSYGTVCAVILVNSVELRMSLLFRCLFYIPISPRWVKHTHTQNKDGTKQLNVVICGPKNLDFLFFT